MQDRRTGGDRRGTNRYPIDAAVEWETAAGRQPGTLSDVSFDGCFVLSNGDVEDGDTVKIFVPLGDGMKVQFDGKIANHVIEIGFGVKFVPLSQAQKEILTKLVKESGG
ncbi:MAG: PilZ domain-containing protein [Acidobacteria bacterium]|nr:PilZ domain-containing protein [Acidobacteriota bacterium]